MTVTPYARVTSGAKARGETTKILQRFGCESVGFMDNFSEYSVTLAFVHRGRPVQLKASAKSWAEMFLRSQPRAQSRKRNAHATREKRALEQGLIAVNSILRDWVKGQVTAIECGMLSFEAVFMPYMLVEGRPLVEKLQASKLLPEPCS